MAAEVEIPAVPFLDRSSAGRLLAQRLKSYAGRPDVIVCALARGGVPVGAEIAKELDVALTVFLVRKLGVPGHEELALGAITSGGMQLINHGVTNALHITDDVIQAVAQRETQELVRRERLYSRGEAIPDFKGKIVIVTDDGIATGSSMKLAAQALRRQGAAYIVIAVPVAPISAVSQLGEVADHVVCLMEPEPFQAVSEWYEDFHQLTDHEVCQILDRHGVAVQTSV
jgi:putative phosphoribosyl transferase